MKVGVLICGFKIKVHLSKINPRARPTFKSSKSLFKVLVNFLRSIIPSLFGRGWGIFHNAFLPKIQTLYFARTFLIITFYQKSKPRSKLFLIKAFNFLSLFRRSHFLLSLTFQNQFQNHHKNHKNHFNTHPHLLSNPSVTKRYTYIFYLKKVLE